MAARKVFAIPELVHLIVEQAEWYERRQLLTISRLFQAAVEPSVWRGYTFRTDSSAEEFLEKYHGHRSRYLRSIDIHIDFPTQVATDGNEIPCRETAKDLQSYNELFTRQILALFTMLKTLEDRELPQNRPRDINLCLRIYRLYRDDHREVDEKCHHRKRLSWRLCLLTHEDLPTLSSVISLRLSQDEYKDDNGAPKVNLPSTPQPLDFGAISSLVSKLPNLDNLEGEWHEDDWQVAYEYAVLIHFTRPWEGPWRDSRHTFGNIIRNAATLPTKIRRIKLEFCRTYAFEYHDQSLPLPNLISPLSYDPFSSGLRIISQRVVNLAIRACVDRNLFWPLDSEGKVESPSWPYLKNLHVEFEPMSPSGIWYFQGPRGEGREANTPFEITQAHYPPVGENPQDKHWDEIWIREWGRWENMQPNMFRITPIDETMELFLEAFIKALEKMPLLEEVELFTRMKFAPDEDLYDTYDADEEKEYLWGLRYLLPKDGGNPLLEWHIGDWRPSERLLQRFHDIAAHRSGNPLEERWMDWKQCNIYKFESFSSVTYME